MGGEKSSRGISEGGRAFERRKKWPTSSLGLTFCCNLNENAFINITISHLQTTNKSSILFAFVSQIVALSKQCKKCDFMQRITQNTHRIQIDFLIIDDFAYENQYLSFETLLRKL